MPDFLKVTAEVATPKKACAIKSIAVKARSIGSVTSHLFFLFDLQVLLQ
jgi:hypothetical protein